MDVQRLVSNRLRPDVMRLRGNSLTFSDCCTLPWAERGYDLGMLEEPTVDTTKKLLVLNFADGRRITLKAESYEGVDLTEAFKTLYKRSSFPISMPKFD